MLACVWASILTDSDQKSLGQNGWGWGRLQPLFGFSLVHLGSPLSVCSAVPLDCLELLVISLELIIQQMELGLEEWPSAGLILSYK